MVTRGRLYSLSHPCPGCGHLPWQRWLWRLSFGEEKSKEMHGKQLLNLEQNSFILWNPKGAESMWAVNLDFTDTYKKDAKPTRVQSIGAFGWLLSSDVTEVDEKRCPTSAGSQARCASRSPGFWSATWEMSEHTVNIFEPQRFKSYPGDSEKDTACLRQEGGRNKAGFPVVLALVKPSLLGPG